MSIFAPNYYKNFKCIANKCLHNCCVGWEIDIDSDTLAYYNNLSGEMGTKIRNNISYTEEPHFKLEAEDRCPFLKKDGLCEIICTLGEDSLCDICADHPRFRNFFSNFTEIGLGLCCEAAAEIILNNEEPFYLIKLEGENVEFSNEELHILNLRDKLIKIMQRRDKSIVERLKTLLSFADGGISSKSVSEWCDFFLSLERLDEKWTEELNALKNTNLDFEDLSSFSGKLEIAIEQLCVYFLYRHMPTSLLDNRISDKIKFSYISVLIIAALCRSNGNMEFNMLLDYARMYSCEIEYSDENLQAVFDKMW